VAGRLPAAGPALAPPRAAAAAPPRRGTLERQVTWRSAVVVALGTALLVTVSMGPMAAELGNASVAVWFASAGVGALQCVLLAHLARRLPERAGGAACYPHVAFGERAPILSAAASWGYWFAWTPGIAVNLILAADYLEATIWPGVDALAVAFALALALYGLNALGLRVTMRAAAAAAAVAAVPLIVLVVGVIAQPGLVEGDRLLPVSVPGDGGGTATWLLVAKWLFVAAWAAYGAEMASTVVAEMRDSEQAGRALGIAAVLGVAAFTLIPILTIAVVGPAGLAEDPTVAFLPLADAVFGSAGETMIGVMLVAALVLGAQAFIIGSSRTVFQMSRDGYLPRRFGAVSRRGVPIGSIAWDAAVILTLLAVFGTDIVDVVAAANFGYLVTFVLLPVAYVVLRRRGVLTGPRGRVYSAMAAALALFNAALLTIGGAQWGAKVVLTGSIVMALIVPICLVRRVRDRRAGHGPLLPFPAGAPQEGPEGAGSR
jgi:amino acid transporter